MDDEQVDDAPVFVVHNFFPIPFPHAADGTCWCYPIVLKADEVREVMKVIKQGGELKIGYRALSA